MQDRDRDSVLPLGKSKMLSASLRGEVGQGAAARTEGLLLARSPQWVTVVTALGQPKNPLGSFSNPVSV